MTEGWNDRHYERSPERRQGRGFGGYGYDDRERGQNAGRAAPGRGRHQDHDFGRDLEERGMSQDRLRHAYDRDERFREDHLYGRGDADRDHGRGDFGYSFDRDTDYGRDYYGTNQFGPGRDERSFGSAFGREGNTAGRGEGFADRSFSGQEGRERGRSPFEGGRWSSREDRYEPASRLGRDDRGGNFGSYYGEGSGGAAGRRGQHVGKGPKGYQKSDARLQEQACEALSDAGDVDASNIEVQVRQGEITLTGSVRTRRTKRLAEAIVEDIAGVKDVLNQLRVQSDTAPAREGTSSPQAESRASPGGTGSQDQGMDKGGLNRNNKSN